MSDSDIRIGSLRLRFEQNSPEPTDAEIFHFMKEKMMLNHETLLCMYKDKTELSVIIKFKTEDDLKAVLKRFPETMDFDYSTQRCCKVQLSAASTVVKYVRLFNLPPEIDDREIWSIMARYGKIQRMVREKYAEETGFPIWTSVRGMYMELKQGDEIPASVHIRNIRARVYYEGLVNKCFQCGSCDHLKVDCPNRKSINDRIQGHTYSGAVKGQLAKNKSPEEDQNDGRKIMTNLNNMFPRFGKSTAWQGQRSTTSNLAQKESDGSCSEDVHVVQEAEHIENTPGTNTLNAIEAEDESTASQLDQRTDKGGDLPRAATSSEKYNMAVTMENKAVSSVGSTTETIIATKETEISNDKASKIKRDSSMKRKGRCDESDSSSELNVVADWSNRGRKATRISEKQGIKTRSRSKHSKQQKLKKNSIDVTDENDNQEPDSK